MTLKKQKKNSKPSTVDAREIRQFDRLGDDWWDESGPMKPLHLLNPVRIGYIQDKAGPLKGKTVVDIGCGGGLVAEPFCRLGARVTGIDAGKKNIRIAAAHAKAGELDIAYLATTAEDLAASGRTFDIVTALEIIEHVADVGVFVDACCALVEKNGTLVLSTLNRTVKSFALGIVAAEHILRWLPPGTHQWRKFLKPSEIAKHLARNGFEPTDVTGLVYNPFAQEFSLSKTDLDVNYLMTAQRIKS